VKQLYWCYVSLMVEGAFQGEGFVDRIFLALKIHETEGVFFLRGDFISLSLQMVVKASDSLLKI